MSRPSAPPVVPSRSPSSVRLSLSMRRTSDHRSRTRLPITGSSHTVGRTRFETRERRSCALRARSTSPTRPHSESPRDVAPRASERGVRGGPVAPSRGMRANKRSRSRESPSPVLLPDGHGSIRPAAAGWGTSCRRHPAGDSGARRIHRRWQLTRSPFHDKHPPGPHDPAESQTSPTHATGVALAQGCRQVGKPVLQAWNPAPPTARHGDHGLPWKSTRRFRGCTGFEICLPNLLEP